MATTLPEGPARVHLDVPRALQQIGDEASMREMLPMLLELLERNLPQIIQMLSSHDARGANPLLHSLKGCLPIFCTPALCDHMAQVEFMSKAGSGQEVNEAFAALLPKLRELHREVEEYLAMA